MRRLTIGAQVTNMPYKADSKSMRYWAEAPRLTCLVISQTAADSVIDIVCCCGMVSRNRWLRLRAFCAIGVSLLAGAALMAYFLPAQAAEVGQKALEPSFEQVVKPFFNKNCVSCHNSDLSTAGVRVDQLDATMSDQQLKVWEAIRNRVRGGSMPPKGLAQPTQADRDRMVAWITQALEVARLRPTPKNGEVRRLTVAQYRNTLKELLHLEDDVSRGLPPDAVSKEGFLNNKDSLQLSPLLTEAYFEIAEDALSRAIVDPAKKPVIQNFRVDLGAGVNAAPLPEKLVLGAGSALLDNSDVLVTQLIPAKPFSFEPFRMRTKYRFIEGYRGNDTVRGWRDFDSIYHAVFADMRGTPGYPTGKAYSTVPQGLLLRPAIPSEEIFGDAKTEGARANFKISVRELPEDGQFRVTVVAAKYRDGLMLETGTKVQPVSADAVIVNNPQTPGTANIATAGIYQVDFETEKPSADAPNTSKLKEGLNGPWPRAGDTAGRIEGNAKLVDSPVGKAISLSADKDGMAIPRKALPLDDPYHVGEGDFTVAAWIYPKTLKKAGIVSLGNGDRTNGWFLDIPAGRGADDDGGGGRGGGALRFQTMGLREPEGTATVSTPPGSLKQNVWQHVAVVMRRGLNDTRIYLNGYLAARSASGFAQFDDPRSDLLIGNIPGTNAFDGDIADVRFYNRPLEEPELQALVQPGRQFVKPLPDRKQDITLNLGDRQFVGSMEPAFLVLRLDAGPLNYSSLYPGVRHIERMVLTPLAPENDLAKKFAVFEKRNPRLGVHLGLRRDCGSTFAPVGPAQTVSSGKPTKYIFEGALKNFPSPEADKDIVNYLAGLREIGVRSEFTDGRDMPRLAIRSVEFEGPYYDTWPPASHKSIFTDFDRKTDLPAYGHKIIHDFATKAYRRPISAGEETALTSVFDESLKEGRGFQDSVKDALLVTLTSPQFLFLIETSKSPAAEPLDGYELASKLSYFLWNGPPDRRTAATRGHGHAAGPARCRSGPDDRRSEVLALCQRVHVAVVEPGQIPGS